MRVRTHFFFFLESVGIKKYSVNKNLKKKAPIPIFEISKESDTEEINTKKSPINKNF